MFSISNSTSGDSFTAWLKIGRREKKVRISKDADTFIQVKVIAASRDSKTGKMTYQTEDTTKVFDATAEQVAKVVGAALEAASAKK